MKAVFLLENLLNSGASDKQWKTNRFMRAVKAYAENADAIATLNPTELSGYDPKGRRILRKRNNQVREYFYLQTVGTPINNNRYNDDDF